MAHLTVLPHSSEQVKKTHSGFQCPQPSFHRRIIEYLKLEGTRKDDIPHLKSTG